MTSLQKAQLRWGTLKVQRAVKAYGAAMQPYNEALSEFPAQRAALLVIGVSLAFAAGRTSQNDVASTLERASEMSGIPIDPWKALSELQIYLSQLHRGKCSVITGGKE